MTLYDLKPAFQALLRPMARRIFERGGTANMVTLAAAAGSILLGLILAGVGPRWPVAFLLLPVWLVVRMALNAIDGLLAREFGQQSRLGAYLNEICDVVSDAALMLPFALVAPFSSALVVIVVVLAGLAELAGALGPSVGATRRYDGPAGKSDRALAFGLLGLWLGLAWQLPDWAAWAMPLIAVLLVVTIVNRVRRGLVEADAGRPSTSSL
jgi:CDP-diacylglycerol---glycerol-3-phosphate 3-phosphatidyltransferase